MHHLAAILFIDIVGYTALMGESEEKALGAVRKLNGISKPLAKAHGGTWHKDLGDGTLFSFGSAIEADIPSLRRSACKQSIQSGVVGTLVNEAALGERVQEIGFVACHRVALPLVPGSAEWVFSDGCPVCGGEI